MSNKLKIIIGNLISEEILYRYPDSINVSTEKDYLSLAKKFKLKEEADENNKSLKIKRQIKKNINETTYFTLSNTEEKFLIYVTCNISYPEDKITDFIYLLTTRHLNSLIQVNLRENCIKELNTIVKEIKNNNTHGNSERLLQSVERNDNINDVNDGNNELAQLQSDDIKEKSCLMKYKFLIAGAVILCCLIVYLFIILFNNSGSTSINLTRGKPIVDYKCQASTIIKEKTSSNCYIIVNDTVDLNQSTSDTFDIFLLTKDTIQVSFNLSKESDNNIKVEVKTKENMIDKRFKADMLIIYFENFNYHKRSFESDPTSSYPYISNTDGLVNKIIKVEFILNSDQSSMQGKTLSSNNLPAGLTNGRNQCYFNSIIQTLNSIGMIKKIFKNYNSNDAQSITSSVDPSTAQEAKNFSKEMKKVLSLLQNNNSLVNPNRLYETLNDFQAGVQEDAHEFLIKVLDIIKLVDKSGKFSEYIDFDILYTYYVKATHEYINSYNELFSFLSIDINKTASSNISIEECITNFFQPEEINDFNYKDNKITADKVGNINKKPEILILHLKRFNYIGGRFVKNNSRVTFDNNLTVKEFNDKKYSLHNIIIHEGQYGSGHYYAYTKIVKGNDEFWVKCNDTQVTSISNLNEIFEGNFGGYRESLNFRQNYNSGKIEITKKLEEIAKSAYILVYTSSDVTINGIINEEVLIDSSNIR